MNPVLLKPQSEVGAQVIVLPGSKATIADLAALHAQGWDIDIAAHARRGGRVLEPDFAIFHGHAMARKCRWTRPAWHTASASCSPRRSACGRHRYRPPDRHHQQAWRQCLSRGRRARVGCRRRHALHCLAVTLTLPVCRGHAHRNCSHCAMPVFLGVWLVPYDGVFDLDVAFAPRTARRTSNTRQILAQTNAYLTHP